MKSFCVLICVVALGSTSSCPRDSGKRIPNGVYREPSKIEAVEVNDTEMKFHIRLLNSLLPGIFTRVYTYELLTTGQISFQGSSNDVVFLEGVTKYTWLWDGKRIVRVRVKFFFDEHGNPQKETGPRVIFASD